LKKSDFGSGAASGRQGTENPEVAGVRMFEVEGDGSHVETWRDWREFE
jgi:hypothetical protein